MPSFASAYWTVSLPDGWTGHNDPECATFVSKGGPGALQISAAKKNDEVTNEDLCDFAREHLDAGAKTKEVTTGDFTGFTFHYGDGERYWRQWFVRHREVAAFITYNCPLSARGEEDAAVNIIISSLKVRDLAH
jgi:hypothetical protein